MNHILPAEFINDPPVAACPHVLLTNHVDLPQSWSSPRSLSGDSFSQCLSALRSAYSTPVFFLLSHPSAACASALSQTVEADILCLRRRCCSDHFRLHWIPLIGVRGHRVSSTFPVNYSPSRCFHPVPSRTTFIARAALGISLATSFLRLRRAKNNKRNWSADYFFCFQQRGLNPASPRHPCRGSSVPCRQLARHVHASPVSSWPPRVASVMTHRRHSCAAQCLLQTRLRQRTSLLEAQTWFDHRLITRNSMLHDYAGVTRPIGRN